MKMELKGLLFYAMLFIIIVAEFRLSQAAAMHKMTLKTIKSQDGDVIDCVHIHHQPAFDHPLLRDHTIKMEPSVYPEGGRPYRDSNQINQEWQTSGNCPEGTVPIIRTEKRATFMKKKHNRIPRVFPISSVSTDDAVNQGHEYAFTYIPTSNYYGAQATISVRQPYVEGTNEFSLSQLWIVGGFDSATNTIEAGWQVFPELYGDNSTRLFIYWTSDDYQNTGCYNLLCSGFVQINNEMAIGGAISTTNTPEITLLVWKDQNQSVWWLQYDGIILGYWPTSIFTILNDSASYVEWGGEIINSNINGVHTATEMGSGAFAQDPSSSYFRNLLVVNNANTLIPPDSINSQATNLACYNITVEQDADWGNFFHYGGPGRNPNCP